MINEELWKKCYEFHGHKCGGLAIGFKAAELAQEIFGENRCDDEEIVTIAENDSCAVDAIQVILGCSIGKGNLLFHMCGKQAYSFYERKSGKSFRLYLKPTEKEMSREESMNYYLETKASELFAVMETKIQLPERAKIFTNHICSICGEKVGDNWLKVVGDDFVCLDCANKYDRFNV